jgi:UDP-GlcNAc:undecaprenyl-phosphate/decaprenyl-phosphate GlcNAc-1-phosphate transferase
MTFVHLVAWFISIIGGFIISIVSNSLLLRFSQSLGIRNKNDVIVRWANQSKPSLGGVSLYMAFLFGSLGYTIVFKNEYILHNKEFVGLLTGGTIAFIMGLADDAYNTKPFAKLFFQILCGLILVFTGTYIHFTNNFVFDSILTTVWVIGIMNSLNMLDNMDGITGTTVLFILFSCLGANFINPGMNSNIWTLTLLIQVGAIIGFLYFNIHPSKLFMGDAGSQFIGFFVAFFSIKSLWNLNNMIDLNPMFGMGVTYIAFTCAAADTFSVVINRLRKGVSPMVGGKDHTTHHLVYKGLNDKQVWYVFLGLGFLSTVSSITAIFLINSGQAFWMIPILLVPICSFIYLFRVTQKYTA